MSLRVMTQGGGSGGETASIFVTGLDENSTVAAVKDGKTVQGKWNSAENRFEISKIKEYGMYTVTATNEKDTATQDVLVDAAVDYEIEMSYRFYLYREGDECVGVTGGWVFPTTHTTQQAATNGSGALWIYDTNSGGGSVTKQKDSDSILLGIYCPAGSIASATAEIQKKIDFTNYTKMCVKVSEAVNGGLMLCARTKHKWAGSALRMWNGDDSDIVVYTGGYENNGVYSTDISGVSGMMNVAVLIGGYFGETTSMSTRFTEVWLEK